MELAIGQGEAVEHLLLGEGQQFLIGENDAVIALGGDGEDTATERIAAGVFQQGRIDAAAHHFLVGFQRFLLGDDACLLQTAPVGRVHLFDQLRRCQPRQRLGGQRLADLLGG